MKFSNINLAVQSAASTQSPAPQGPAMPAPAQLPPEAMAAPAAVSPAPVPPACQMVPPAPVPPFPEAMAMPPFPETPLPPAPPFMDAGYGQVPPPPIPAPAGQVAPAAAPIPQQASQSAPRVQAAPAPAVQNIPASQQAPRTQAPAAKEDHYDDSWMPLELRKNRSLMGLYGKKPRTPAPAASAPRVSQSHAAALPTQAAPAPAVQMAPAAVAPIPQADSAAPAAMSALVQMAREFEMCKGFLADLSRSRLCPKALRGSPNEIFYIIQQGQDVGLPPLQALQSISIINGKPCMYGDGMLALCIPHGDVQEQFDEQKQVATCTCRRPGKTPVTRTFSLQEAMNAGLVAFDKEGHALGKSNEGWTRNVPWGSYTRRMLQMRARGFALRDAFPDILKGIISAEEAMDYKV